MCSADLDALGKRPDAETCGAACRRERSRRRHAARNAPVGGGTRARRVRRAGVSVYLPSLDVARELRATLLVYVAPGVADDAIEALNRAIGRRERLAGQPGVGGTGADEAKGA